MKTLVLGHGRNYSMKDIQCSTFPVDNWYNTEYTCIDIDKDVKPDIVFNLKERNWTFCGKNEYNLIVDTGGLAFYSSSSGYNIFFLQNICKYLQEGGTFYGWKNETWKKINGKLAPVKYVNI